MATAATATAPRAPGAAGGTSGRKPGWMSIPGGPKEPNGTDFRAKMAAMSAQRAAIYEKLKELAARAGGDRASGMTDEAKAERDSLRARLNAIDAERKGQRGERKSKADAIATARKERQDLEARLKELMADVGSFASIEEVNAAIDRVSYLMETGGSGSLAAEKATMKKLQRLQEVRGMLDKLGPLGEAIEELQDREHALQLEQREIHDRLAVLNAEFEAQAAAVASKGKESRQGVEERVALSKEREALRAELVKLNQTMDAERDAFTKAQEAWSAWRIEAQKKYEEKMAAERAERERRWKERHDAERLERKQRNAARRQNPKEAEINACTTLVQYLKDKRAMVKRDDEERRRRAAQATFDPAAAAPPGFALPAGSAFAGVKPSGKKAAAAAAAPATKRDDKERMIQHDENKSRLFALIGVDKPLTLAAIDGAIDAIVAKQKEYEALIRASAELSSDTEEDEAAAEADAAPAAAAAAAAAE